MKKKKNKIRLLKKEFFGGLKQKEEIIEVSEREAERLLQTDSLDVFYSTFPKPKHK